MSVITPSSDLYLLHAPLEADMNHQMNFADATAQFNLGACYEEGTGVPRIYMEAVKWYKMAAGQKDVMAQIVFGNFLSQDLILLRMRLRLLSGTTNMQTLKEI